MKEAIKYYIKRVVCFLTGHDWYIIDYFYGMENNNIHNIKECFRCHKEELD